MLQLDVTDKVWKRILSVKTGDECLCCGTWTTQESQSLSVYGALAQPGGQAQVFAQIGQSLDGRIATETGDSQDVSGKDGLMHLHRLRALADAVIIGVNTAIHDNPQLTVRLTDGQSPARIVIDPDGRLPNQTRLLQDSTVRSIVIQAVEKQRPKGVETITLRRSTFIDPKDILDALKQKGFKRILIEGGGITIAHFLEAGLLDRLHVSVAPLLIGSGPQSLSMAPISTLAQARRPETNVYNLGTDILFDCALSIRNTPPAKCQSSKHSEQPV